MQSIGEIGPIKTDLFHVQGIAMATGTIFVTSVSKADSSAFLWKIDRKTLNVVAKKNITENIMFHPSGLQYDGKYLWVAVAVYSKNSKAEVLKIDASSLKIIKKFKVPDHIGLVASDGRGKIYGGNWDAEKFYVWDEKGKLLETHGNPTKHGYQDCKLTGSELACSGGGYVDIIDTETWKVAQCFIPGDTRGGNDLTREGADLAGGTFYFLPDDGAGTSIYIAKPAVPAK